MLVALQSLAAQEERHVLGAPEETLSAHIIQVACSKNKGNWYPNRIKVFRNLQPLVLSKVGSNQASRSQIFLRKARYHGTVTMYLCHLTTLLTWPGFIPHICLIKIKL
jgi:hypothetical protein